MTFNLRLLTALTVLCGLCACGGTPLIFDDAAPFGPMSSDEVGILSDGNDQLSTEVLDIAPTPAGGVERAGGATFTGLAELTVSPDGDSDSMSLIGETVLIANFDTRAVTATMFNFAGLDLTGGGQRLDGSLAMNDGSIGSFASNSVFGTFQGVLVGEDFEIVADGQLNGTFRDVPTSAISFTGVDDTALINSERAQLTLSGIAQD